MKTLTVIGARPQFVKAAMMSRKLKNDVLVHTGQHYDKEMSAVFFDELDIPEPDYNLGIGSGSHGEQTGRMLEAVEQVLLKEKPDIVIVHGDTNSTLAGALAAAKLKIPVAHVEAGLRSYSQMPEEINRRMVDHLSSYLFAPTVTAVNNLNREGLGNIYHVGDVMYDAFLRYSEEVKKGDYILATIHREENTDDGDRLGDIFSELNWLGNVICPLHPRTKARLKNKYNRITFIDPVGYREMLKLIGGARIVVTDSGGVQKEAYFSKTPCVTVRPQTEWTELVEAGWNILVDTVGIVGAVRRAKSRMILDGRGQVDYGDGNAAGRIVAILEKTGISGREHLGHINQQPKY